MKAEIGVAEQETFVAAYLLRFENGLVMRTKDCLWLGKAEHEKLKQEFVAVVKGLEAAGIEIVGWERLQ